MITQEIKPVRNARDKSLVRVLRQTQRRQLLIDGGHTPAVAAPPGSQRKNLRPSVCH